MASFQVPTLRTPFGPTVFLRSTQDVKTTSYTCSAAAVTAETFDGATGQKILQKGEAMCKITSGPEIGKVGPFQAGATDGRQTIANFVGFNNTFLPWTLTERDVEIAIVYEATVYAAMVTERNSSNVRIPLAGGSITSLTAVSSSYRFIFA